LTEIRCGNEFILPQRLGDELAKLSLGFPNGNRFHADTLVFGTTSRKRLPDSNREPRQTRERIFTRRRQAAKN
jgi:hypothetical protein